MRIMALDAGDKRIGVALSDPLGLTGQGLTVLANNPAVPAAVAALCREYQVEQILVGLPKNMNNTMGPRAKWALEFADRVAAATGLPVAMEDERLTTAAANRVLLAADLSRRKRRQNVDKLAATFILQSYLDRLEKK